MGAGRRRLAAGAAAWRRCGQARRRSLRGAWRQDGATGACRRLGDRGRQLEDAARAACRESRRGSGLQAERVLADAASWQPGEAFDAVLLDAPCSSTGTIRRHPDIPYTQVAQGHRGARRASRRGCSTMPPSSSSRAAGSSIRPARSSPRRARRKSRPCWCETRLCASIPSARTSFSARTAWIEPSGCLRTFPYELRLEYPRMERNGRVFCHTTRPLATKRDAYRA